MFWFPRRNTIIFLALATFSIFCYLYLQRTILYKPRGQISRPSVPLRFESPWTARNETYPVESFHLLPSGLPIAFPKVQVGRIVESVEAKAVRESRLLAIKQSFLHTWKGYHDHAWLADELMPVSGGKKYTWGNWSATLVDSLDTLWIMGLDAEFDEAVQAVSKIDFERSTSTSISVFETTIRYLGGLLSAYELSGRDILLEQAVRLGHMLYAAFDTPSRLPVPHLNWQRALENQPQDTTERAISADLGSLSLEFTKLSQLTGELKFFDAVQRISELFAEQQDTTELSGLWPIIVDAKHKDFSSGIEFSFGGMADSLYEYTSKMHILLGGLKPEYGRMYEKAIDAAKKHLFFRPMNRDNRDLLLSTTARAYDDVVVQSASGQHLACFVGGMVGQGAKIFRRKEDLDVARRLTDGCQWGYEVMHAGIMPEIMVTVPCSSAKDCSWDEKIWHDALREHYIMPPETDIREFIAQKRLPPGVLSISDGRYILRPEAIESIFYMYRITGDATWQDKAWSMYQAIDKATKTKYGYSAIANVAAEKLVLVDSMESFWTAETLKYLYLIFSDIDLINLDEWVLNTEAHPFRRLLPRNYAGFG